MLNIARSIKMLIFAMLLSQNAYGVIKNQSEKTAVQGQELYDNYPWSLLYYYGFSINDPLSHIVYNWSNLHRWPETIQSIELSRTLNKQNGFRKFFSPIVGVVELTGNITIRQGKNEPTIYEFDPYITFRWANFPWNDILVMSLAVGEGLSYVTSVPALEKKYSDNTKRLLNYLMLEMTVSLPRYPRLQTVLRIHHRSGAYGLYNAGNTGSNNIGLGIRYLFA